MDITTFTVRSNGQSRRPLNRERIAAKAKPIIEETTEAPTGYLSKADLVAMAEAQGVDSTGTRTALAERLGVDV